MDMITKAACALFVHDSGGPEERWHTRADQAEYEARVRAVLEAMREPTRRMVSEGESAASVGIGKPSDDDALPRVWTAMIDAALAKQAQT